MKLFIPLVGVELEGVASGAAVIMGRPSLDGGSLTVGPLGEEAFGPIAVVTVGTGGDQVEGHVVLGHPFGELAVFAAVVFRNEVPAAAPAFVADTPVADAEGLGGAVGCALVGDGGSTGRCVAVFEPLLEFFGRAGTDIGGEIGLDLAELAETDEFVGAEVVGLGFLFPASEATGSIARGPMPSRQ